jgi:hypothetical protein
VLSPTQLQRQIPTGGNLLQKVCELCLRRATLLSVNVLFCAENDPLPANKKMTLLSRKNCRLWGVFGRLGKEKSCTGKMSQRLQGSLKTHLMRWLIVVKVDFYITG